MTTDQLITRPETLGGWRIAAASASLPEVHRSVAVPKGATLFRKLLAFSGPGYLISVGYIDPGNWATDIAGGSAFGYSLLSVIILSNLLAMLLQGLSAKLAIVTGRDLAQACREHYSPSVATALWVLSELGICACDLAEVLGTAVALNLLFGLPLLVGVCLTAADVLVVLLLQRRGFRHLEAFVVGLIGLVGGGLLFDVLLAQPAIGDLVAGLVPRSTLLSDPKMLYIGIGIVGATIMPHNLYLHSSIVQTRRYDTTLAGKREAIRFAIFDSSFALTVALFINAAILVMAAAAFHTSGHTEVTEIQDAYALLTPILGAPLAATVFAVALLAAGQNSAVTATLAGQIVMEGFLNFSVPSWLRRLITRLVAIVPAVIVTALEGDTRVTQLLILSQVVLSLQLPFAVVPLVKFTSTRSKMGAFVNGPSLIGLAWGTAAVIIGLNLRLLADMWPV
jgi:manganese transport protein